MLRLDPGSAFGGLKGWSRPRGERPFFGSGNLGLAARVRFGNRRFAFLAFLQYLDFSVSWH